LCNFGTIFSLLAKKKKIIIKKNEMILKCFNRQKDKIEKIANILSFLVNSQKLERMMKYVYFLYG